MIYSSIEKERKKHLAHLKLVMKRLHEEQLAINLEKFVFMQQELVYLGFVVSKGNMKMNPSKVEAILDWPNHKIGTKVRIFHGLAQFYRKFLRNFGGICVPILDTIKGGLKKKFKWIEVVEKAFQTLKQEVATKPILLLTTFDKLFTIECDASSVAVGGVLSQEGRLVTFFNEKLNEAKKKYSTYD